jgi:hypothetical protein
MVWIQVHTRYESEIPGTSSENDGDIAVMRIHTFCEPEVAGTSLEISMAR